MSQPVRRSALSAMRSAPIFSALDDAALGRLMDGCRLMRVGAGEMIFGPRQAARSFFVVLAGRVKIFMLSPRGDEQILHIYGPGETFGEAAMWAGDSYPAFAQALADAELAAVGREELRRAIRASPELAIGMLAGMSAKLRQFQRLIEDLSLKEVPARVAGVLLAESARAGSKVVRLRQTKRELAAQVGTVAETLSRVLAKMRADGLISMRGRVIEILDPAGLKDLASSG